MCVSTFNASVDDGATVEFGRRAAHGDSVWSSHFCEGNPDRRGVVLEVWKIFFTLKIAPRDCTRAAGTKDDVMDKI